MASAVPDHVCLVRRAQRGLEGLPADERTRLIADIIRLAHRTLPGEIQPIAALPGRPLQVDAGRFRILHHWEGRTLWVFAIVARAQQSRVFRSLRRGALPL